MESKKINQLATELTPALDDLTIIGDPITGISKKITLSQMASLFTGTVEEYANLAAFPLVGVADTIYIALDTNVLYRWDTGLTSYVELSPNIINSLVFSDANGFDGNISLVGSTATLTITTALTQGSVPFIGASGALSQDNANLFFDDTNNRLGINTNAPTTALDVFGSGIIGRLNGTSTNNSFLGFANAGTNKWSIGNVQSDHRFRIYSEANTAELVSVLQTGEFGIGIANPTTKLHIDGGASALIANLDADVSIAKSISFRSDNSARINLEVSGTESGSNAGMDLFVRTYTDAGALLATPLTITRSTGAITLTGALSGTTATFSGIVSETKTADGIIQKIGGNTTKANIYQFSSGGIAGGVFNIGHNFYYDGTNYGQDNTAKSGWVTSSNLNSDTFSIARAAAGSTSAPTTILSLASTGVATFSSNLNVNGERLYIGGSTNNAIINNIASIRINIDCDNNNAAGENFTIGHNQEGIDNNNVLFRVQDDGKVGINTSTASTTLHINSAADTTLTIDSGGTAYSSTISFVADSERAKIIGGYGSTGGGYLAFNVDSSGGTDLERMRITSTGALSIKNGTQPTGNGLHSYFTSDVGYIDSLESNVAWRNLRLAGNDIIFWTGGIERARMTSNGNVVLAQKLITSQAWNQANVGSGGTTSVTLSQPQFEYQSTYLVSIVGLYAPSGVNQNGFYTGLVTFFNDSSIAQANVSALHANGWGLSVSANTSGTFTFTFNNASGGTMTNIWIRILKINKTFDN